MKTFSKKPNAAEVHQHVPCPLCGTLKFLPRWTIEGARFVTCKNCQVVMQNPRPMAGDLSARYDQEYFRYEIDNEDNFFSLMIKGLEDIRFFDLVDPTLPPVRRVLDLGCATGRLLSHFKGLGWKTAGVEMCRESADYGNRKYDVGIRVGDFLTMGFPDGYFSVVHASHLIEHVHDPSAFADEISRILVPGGVFICVTPSTDGFQARLFGSKWRSAIADHVTLFSKKTLSRLMNNAGMPAEDFKTWGGLAVGSAPSWLKRIADGLAKKYGFGDVILCLARKSYIVL